MELLFSVSPILYILFVLLLRLHLT
jgi:hypothetical protein